jgi:hypothetical protein
VDESIVSEVERGKFKPSVELAERLIAAVECTVAQARQAVMRVLLDQDDAALVDGWCRRFDGDIRRRIFDREGAIDPVVLERIVARVRVEARASVAGAASAPDVRRWLLSTVDFVLFRARLGRLVRSHPWAYRVIGVAARGAVETAVAGHRGIGAEHRVVLRGLRANLAAARIANALSAGLRGALDDDWIVTQQMEAVLALAGVLAGAHGNVLPGQPVDTTDPSSDPEPAMGVGGRCIQDSAEGINGFYASRGRRGPAVAVVQGMAGGDDDDDDVVGG